MAGFGWGATGAGAVCFGFVLLGFALLSVPTGLGAAPLARVLPPALELTETNLPPATANLTIDPGSTWAQAGDATSLVALWSPGDPSCTVSPVWFRWFLGHGPAGGTFSDANSSTVSFVGTTAGSGTALVGVRSGAEVRCGSETDGLLSTALASVLEVAPLQVQDIEIGSAPLVGGSAANLTGRVEGGAPPYEMAVRWTNSSLGVRNLSSPGEFVWSHTFRPGTYLPQVSVTDATGAEVSAVVSQPLQVNGNAAAAVAASTPVAEVGVPVRFTGEFLGLPPTAFTRLTACGETANGRWGIPPVLVCTPGFVGTITVSLAGSAGPTWPALAQTLHELVVPSLSLTVQAPPGEGEVGVGTVFGLAIAGGSPPFVVTTTFNGSAPAEQQEVPEDGTLRVSVQPASTGFARLSVTVTDAAGAEVSLSNSSLFVGPALRVGASVTSSAQPPAARADLSASVQGGVGPVTWVLHSEPAFGSGDPPAGWLPVAAAFRWYGSFSSEGTGSIALSVMDASGALVNATVQLELVAPLAGELRVSALNASQGSGVTVDLNLSGGAPPVAVWINASGGATWNATDPSDGLFEATVPIARAGATSVVVVALDRLGGKVAGGTFVITRAAPDPPAPPSTSWAPGEGLATLGLLAVSAGAFFYLRRRRHRLPPPATPDPVKVLERILSPADGADRITVELLAEEQGVPLETVRSTLARLIGTGTVRSEVSPDGEEVLAWSDDPPP